jgi:hypothetical protein
MEFLMYTVIWMTTAVVCAMIGFTIGRAITFAQLHKQQTQSMQVIKQMFSNVFKRAVEEQAMDDVIRKSGDSGAHGGPDGKGH